jgi:hypothetical protein
MAEPLFQGSAIVYFYGTSKSQVSLQSNSIPGISQPLRLYAQRLANPAVSLQAGLTIPKCSVREQELWISTAFQCVFFVFDDTREKGWI